MPEITLTDNTLDSVLAPGKPVLILLTDGSGIRSDFSAAFKKAADERRDMVFARLNPAQNPEALRRLKLTTADSGKTTLIGWYDGELIVRRPRPWGTDVPLAIEMMERAMKGSPVSAPDSPPAGEAAKPVPVTQNSIQNKDKTPMTDMQKFDNKPVIVTDATFQAEVIDQDLPVLVDFWAAWCGPCRMVAPILDKLAAEYAGQIRIAKVDVDANPGLSQTFQITSIPNLMMIKNRTIVFNQPGALPEGVMRDLVQQLIALEVPAQKPEAEEQTAD